MRSIREIQEARMFTATGSNFRSLLMLDCFYKSIELNASRNSDALPRIVEKTKNLYSFCDVITRKSTDFFIQEFLKYQKFTKANMTRYMLCYASALKEIQPCLEKTVNTQAAFNTFVKNWRS